MGLAALGWVSPYVIYLTPDRRYQNVTRARHAEAKCPQRRETPSQPGSRLPAEGR
jgi:hypothetical protein